MFDLTLAACHGNTPRLSTGLAFCVSRVEKVELGHMRYNTIKLFSFRWLLYKFLYILLTVIAALLCINALFPCYLLAILIVDYHFLSTENNLRTTRIALAIWN